MTAPRMSIAAGATAALLLLSGCGKTTIVDVTSVPTTAEVAATTTLPSGTASQLASELSELSFSLSGAIVDGRGKQTFAQIQALWDALAARLPRTEFVVDLEDRVEFMRNAVERKRPADADKAALHIRALVDAAQSELSAG